jgi:hypothetical protein
MTAKWSSPALLRGKERGDAAQQRRIRPEALGGAAAA